MGLKFLIKELVYKFFVDYLSKNFIYKNKNFKFVDLFLNNLVSKGFSFFISLGFSSNLYMKNLGFSNLLVLVIFLVFLF